MTLEKLLTTGLLLVGAAIAIATDGPPLAEKVAHRAAVGHADGLYVADNHHRDLLLVRADAKRRAQMGGSEMLDAILMVVAANLSGIRGDGELDEKSHFVTKFASTRSLSE